jgi:hypothetical protein
MKTQIIFWVLFTISISVFAQKDPIKWKELSKEEIELKSYNENPDFPAVILYDYGQMYFDTNPNGEHLFLIRKRHVRIKILNEEGLKYAKQTFSFHDMHCEQFFGELSYSLKAVTHNFDKSGEETIIKLKNKAVKIRDTLNCTKIAEFEFPDAKVGSILEFILLTPTLTMLKPEPWYFENELPVIYSEFRAAVPNNFKYIFSLKNTDVLSVRDSSFYNRSLAYQFRIYQRIYTSVIDLSGTEYRFVNQNMPVMKNKNEAEKINIYLKRLKTIPENYAWERLSRSLMITSYPDYEQRTPGQRKMLNYPAAYIIYYLPDWSELNTRLLNDEKFGLALIKYWNCDSLLQANINPEMNETEKAEAIYNTVRSNMKWNNEYSLFSDVSDGLLKKIYGKIDHSVKYNNLGLYFEKGTGSSAEMNFVFMYLLKRAEINVTPVLVNIKSREPVDRNAALINQFTSVIAKAEIDGKIIFLDVADSDSQFNKLSDKYDYMQMFVVSKENFGWLFN